MFFLLVGFALVLIIRWQHAYTGQPIPLIGGLLGETNAPGGLIAPEFYNQLGAMHSTIMCAFVGHRTGPRADDVAGQHVIADFSSLLGAMNFIATIMQLRAPGMTWFRLPFSSCGQFITAPRARIARSGRDRPQMRRAVL